MSGRRYVSPSVSKANQLFYALFKSRGLRGKMIRLEIVLQRLRLKGNFQIFFPILFVDVPRRFFDNHVFIVLD